MANLAFLVGADVVEEVVETRLSRPERVLWNQIYPQWRSEIRTRLTLWKGEDSDKMLRWYYLSPTPERLDSVVATLGLRYVKRFAEKRSGELRKSLLDGVIWDSTAVELEKRLKTQTLLHQHLDDPDSVSLEEIVEVDNPAYLERYAQQMQEEAEQGVKKDVLKMSLEALTDGPIPLPVGSAFRLHDRIKKKKEEEERRQEEKLARKRPFMAPL